MKIRLFVLFVIPGLQAHCQPTAQKTDFDSLYRQYDKARDEAIGKPFPPFSITNGIVQLNNENLIGKTVYINFWFAACAPCMREMPAVNELYEKYKSDTNFVFLSITFEVAEKINTVKQKQQIKYNVFSVPHQDCMRLNISRTYPANIVLDKRGIVRFYDTGAGIFIKRNFKRKIYRQIDNCLKEQ
jgi:thiol-disulfide isomerase/thioredoxin